MPTIHVAGRNFTFSAATLLLGSLGALFNIGGNAGQVIALNFWLNGFANNDGPYTVLTLVGTTVAIAYGIALLGWCKIKRPNLAFAKDPKCIAFGAACGFCYSLNGLLLVFATADTPELMQVMLISTGIFWTFITASLVELAMKGTGAVRQLDRRALLVPLSFFLCVAGIIVGAGSYNLEALSYDQKKWMIVFAIAQIPGAVFNVMSAQYMLRYSETQDARIVTPIPGSNYSFHSQSRYELDKHTSDPTTVKLVLLFVSAVSQAAFLWAYFPVNFIPGFGADTGYSQAHENLKANYRCVFFGCPSSNFGYFVAFAGSYASALVGLAILNHFSAPLCSMVTQISTPVADLLLIIFPVLNVDQSSYNVGAVIGALVLITVGSLLYVSWTQFMQPEPEAHETLLPVISSVEDPIGSKDRHSQKFTDF